MSDTTTQLKLGELHTVNFIGKEFNIPVALDEYIELLSFFGKMKDSLNLTIRKIIIDKVSDGTTITVGSDEEIETMFKAQASKAIKKLCNHGIYNRTADNYLNNKGYELFCETNQEGVRQSLQFLIEQMEAYASGWQEATITANASISGSGINVYSSNFIPLAVAAAYDYSCTKNQFEKADQQYKNKMRAISSSASSATQKKTIRYVDEVFLPNAEIAVSVFAFSMMDQYLADTNFDQTVFQYTDYKKSQGLLENLKLSSDKKAVLEAAFTTCPFNVAVYEETAKLNLCDLKSMKTALKYCPENTIAKKIVGNCKIRSSNCDFSEEYKRIASSLPIVALQMKTTEAAAIKALFETPYNLYINNFSALSNAASSSGKNRKTFVLTYIANKADSLYSMSQGQVREKVSGYANNLINNENYRFLINLGFDFSKFISNDSSQSPVDYWIDTITNSVVQYISVCKSQHELFVKLKTDYNITVQKKSQAIAELERDLFSLGLFAFSKKRELKEQISHAKDDLGSYHRQVDFEGKKTTFEANYI